MLIIAASQIAASQIVVREEVSLPAIMTTVFDDQRPHTASPLIVARLRVRRSTRCNARFTH
ncbi:MAG: hypothetical protein D6823_06385 [Chloroflexi bacterium]|nr:MAG: hypothetical protein D6823_06385 [Chloroflexota bacterium]